MAAAQDCTIVVDRPRLAGAVEAPPIDLLAGQLLAELKTFAAALDRLAAEKPAAAFGGKPGDA